MPRDALGQEDALLEVTPRTGWAEFAGCGFRGAILIRAAKRSLRGQLVDSGADKLCQFQIFRALKTGPQLQKFGVVAVRECSVARSSRLVSARFEFARQHFDKVKIGRYAFNRFCCDSGF